MLAVQLSAEDLRPRLPDELSLAAINSPASCVVSGTVEMISAFAGTLSDAGNCSYTASHFSCVSLVDDGADPRRIRYAR